MGTNVQDMAVPPISSAEYPNSIALDSVNNATPYPKITSNNPTIGTFDLNLNLILLLILKIVRKVKSRNKIFNVQAANPAISVPSSINN